MSRDQSVSASARTTWLAKLEVDGKVKSSLLNSILAGDQETTLRLLEGDFEAKDLRSKEYKNLPTGLTALHLAALFGDDRAVRRLLELKANPKVTCYCQITSHSVSTKFWMDARPLLFAVGAKHKSIIQQLINAGAPVTIDDAWPLYSGEWWQLTGRFDWADARDILDMLVTAGLNINARAAKIRWTYLHYVANMEPRSLTTAVEFLQARQDTASFLLDHGADPLLKDTFGRTVYALLEDKTSGNDQESEFQRMKYAADEKLKKLIHDGMRDRLVEVKQAGGLKGSMQRIALQGQSLDRLPLLLRSGASSLRRFSLGSSTNVSTVGHMPTEA